MIKREEIEIKNLYMEGFLFSQTAPLTLTIGEGKINEFRQNEDNQIVLIESLYPSFQFDIVPDDELAVVYDIYLLDKNLSEGLNVHIDRTEILPETTPYYEGEAPLKHCIVSFSVPPLLTDLSEITITPRYFVLKEEGEI